MSLGSIGCMGDFVLSADGAPADIVSYVGIYARPIHCLSSLGLHPTNALMCSMQINKGSIEELWEYADSCPLEEKTGIDRQFIPDTPEVSGNVRNFLLMLRPSPKGEAIDGAIHWVLFHRALNDVQFSIRQLDMLNILGNGDGDGV